MDMAMKQFILFTAVLILFTQSSAVIWKSCIGKKVSGNASKVLVSDCPEKSECMLHKGKNYTIEVDFTAGKISENLTAVVHGIIAGVPVPFPLPNNKGCEKCGIKCPVKKGQKYYYKSTISVKTSYPAIKLAVKWELKDKTDTDVFCVELPVEIVN